MFSERDDASKVKINCTLVYDTCHFIPTCIMASSSTSHPLDPVDISPLSPLQDSYTYHSAPFDSPEGEEWIMGIDEAGRGRELPAVVSCLD